jgi:multisubunit Na+/H+ antiporter MnhG subunit
MLKREGLFIMVIFNKISKYFPESIDEEQCKDSGMALVLICLLIVFFGEKNIFVPLSIIFLIINMVVPTAFRRFAKIWLGISDLLGTIVSKIILTIIFYLLVTPVGVLRRLMGKDSLQIKEWKKDTSSAFAVREHLYNADEIEKPY